MKVYKYSICITFFILIISFAMSFCYNRIDNDFLTNLFLGILASCFLVFVTSIIEYYVRKKDVIYKLYSDIYEFLDLVGLEDINHQGIYDLYDYRKSVRKCCKYYKNINLDFSNICLFLRKSKLKDIIITLKDSVSSFYLKIAEDQAILDKFALGDLSLEEVKCHTFYTTKNDEAPAHAKKIILSLENLSKFMKFYGKE